MKRTYIIELFDGKDSVDPSFVLEEELSNVEEIRQLSELMSDDFGRVEITLKEKVLSKERRVKIQDRKKLSKPKFALKYHECKCGCKEARQVALDNSVVIVCNDCYHNYDADVAEAFGMA